MSASLLFCVLSDQTKNMLLVYTMQFILEGGYDEFRKCQCVGFELPLCLCLDFKAVLFMVVNSEMPN